MTNFRFDAEKLFKGIWEREFVPDNSWQKAKIRGIESALQSAYEEGAKAGWNECEGAFKIPQLEEAKADGRREGIEEAADLVDKAFNVPHTESPCLQCDVIGPLIGRIKRLSPAPPAKEPKE